MQVLSFALGVMWILGVWANYANPTLILWPAYEMFAAFVISLLFNRHLYVNFYNLNPTIPDHIETW